MLNKTIQHFLEHHHIPYISINHPPSYSAQEVAAAAHVSGKKMAKAVIVKINGSLAMIVLPAKDYVNFSQLRKLISSDNITLALEDDFKNAFPECELGAIPPFGNLYGMATFVSKALSHDDIIFSSGSHTELVKMNYHDFIHLVKPIYLSSHGA